jgi:hypothetical protein
MRRRTLNRAPDQVIGYITVKDTGEQHPVAVAMTTRIGRSYRTMYTTNWYTDHDVIADSAVIEAAINNPDGIAARINLDNEFTNLLNDDRVKKVKVNGSASTIKRAKQTQLNNNNNIRKRNNTMEKSALKSVISSLSSSQVINITFIGDRAHLSRDWTVVKVRTGKGKGGSKILELVDSARNTLTTGTPDSAYILNMTVNGTMHGYSSEADVPVVYESNPERSAELKQTFKSLVGAEGQYRVNIQSTITDLNGTFMVNRGTQLRGRGGQIRLELERVGSGERVEVWSNRHSGVIQSFTIDPAE